jgi:hypothetical protein
MINEDSLQKRNAAMLPHLNERTRKWPASISSAPIHGEWNYTIASSNQSREAVVS